MSLEDFCPIKKIDKRKSFIGGDFNPMERLYILEQQLKVSNEIKSEKTSNKSKFIIRDLELTDYKKGFPSILSGLTEVGNVTFEEFKGIF